MRIPALAALVTLASTGTALAAPCNADVQAALDWVETPPAGKDRALQITLVQLGSLGGATYLRAELTQHSPANCSGTFCVAERAYTDGYTEHAYSVVSPNDQVCDNPFDDGNGPLRVTLSLPIGISGGGLSVSKSSSGTGPTFTIPMSGLTCDSGPMLGVVPNAIFGATKYLIHIARLEYVVPE